MSDCVALLTSCQAAFINRLQTDPPPHRRLNIRLSTVENDMPPDGIKILTGLASERTDGRTYAYKLQTFYGIQLPNLLRINQLGDCYLLNPDLF